MKRRSLNSLEAVPDLVAAYFQRGPVRRLAGAIYSRLVDHHGAQLASAMAFDLFLSLIPLMALAGWTLSLVLQDAPETMVHLSAWLDLTPADVHAVAQQHAERFSGATLAPLAVVGALWLGSGAFDTVMTAFERTTASQPRSWWKRRALAIGCVFGALGSLSLGAWIAVRLAGGPEYLLSRLPHPQELDELVAGFDVPKTVGIVVSTTTIALLIAGFFRVGLIRNVPQRRVWPGTLVTLFITATTSYALALYARTLARYAFYYGSLAAVAILLAWLWLCSFGLLLGAEVNVYLEDNPQFAKRRTQPPT